MIIHVRKKLTLKESADKDDKLACEVYRQVLPKSTLKGSVYQKAMDFFVFKSSRDRISLNTYISWVTGGSFATK